MTQPNMESAQTLPKKKASVDKTERKKLKDFFNKIVDKWKVSSNDRHMGIITFGSNESLIFVLHIKISQC